MVKWVLDWDICWEEAGATLGRDAQRGGGGMESTTQPAPGSTCLTCFWTGSNGLRPSLRSNHDEGKRGDDIQSLFPSPSLTSTFSPSSSGVSGSCCYLFLLFTSSRQCQGKAAIPAAAARHLCQDLCPPERRGSARASERLLAETLGDASPWAKSPQEGSAVEPVGTDPRSAPVHPARIPLQEAAGSSASAPEVPTATSAEHGRL